MNGIGSGDFCPKPGKKGLKSNVKKSFTDQLKSAET
jgi:hypothetical protein